MRAAEQAICQVWDGPQGVNFFELHVDLVHIGENDVSHIGADQVMKCYLDFADQLASKNSVEVIVLCKLLLFPGVVRIARNNQ